MVNAALAREEAGHRDLKRCSSGMPRELHYPVQILGLLPKPDCGEERSALTARDAAEVDVDTEEVQDVSNDIGLAATI